MKHLTLLQNWYQQVWTDGDLDAIENFFSHDACEDGLVPGLSVHPDEFRDVIEAIRELLDDLTFEITPLCEGGEWLCAVVKTQAMSSATEAQVNAHGMVAVRVRDGKFIEAVNCFDFLQLFEQLGLLPPDTMLTCLTGAAIT